MIEIVFIIASAMVLPMAIFDFFTLREWLEDDIDITDVEED